MELLSCAFATYELIKCQKAFNDLQEKTSWISVKDKLPKPYEDVLVSSELGTKISWIDNADGRFYAVLYPYGHYGTMFISDLDVTHWMPLPQLPEEK